MAERIDAVKTSFFGKGAVRLLGPELKKMGITRALLVTDRFLYESGAAAKVAKVLSDAGVAFAVYYNVQPNPTVQVVNDCIAAASAISAQMLVALGGGSAIDTAKAASIVLANGGSVEQYEGTGKSARPGLPIVAINTTAGTGSECTSFYIVTDPVRHSKMAMVDTNCMVAIAVNDTDFMRSMPPKLTAATGMDALTHAIEAVLSQNASPITDKDALWAIETITKYLPLAVRNGEDEQARTMMAYAENVAGMAFSNAGPGMVHAMARAGRSVQPAPWGVQRGAAALCPCLRCAATGVSAAISDHRQGHEPSVWGAAGCGGCGETAQSAGGHLRQPEGAEGGGSGAFCRAVRPCHAGYLHEQQSGSPHPGTGHCRVYGGPLRHLIPRINAKGPSFASNRTQSENCHCHR